MYRVKDRGMSYGSPTLFASNSVTVLIILTVGAVSVPLMISISRNLLSAYRQTRSAFENSMWILVDGCVM